VFFYVFFMCKCVLPPGVNPTAVDKYIDINNSKTFCVTFYKEIYVLLLFLRMTLKKVSKHVEVVLIITILYCVVVPNLVRS
jgi:hypothetical protein